MALEILTDPRIRNLQWKDLRSLTRRQIANELTLSLPWLVLSWFCFYLAQRSSLVLLLPGAIASFYFFLTGLRQTHNAHHYALGISRLGTELAMLSLSILMTGSMHAIQATHLHHHKHCMDEDDWEAMSARMPGWRALLLGPYFPVKLHFMALKMGNRKQRRWIYVDLIANAIWAVLVFGFLDITCLKIHVVAMLVGQSCTGFFAVWTVHHDCDRSHFIGRTTRGRWRRFMTYNMFYHIEHHLFPKVPTCHLHILAERLDRVAPELHQKRVF